MKTFSEFLLGHNFTELTEGLFSFGVPVDITRIIAGVALVIILVWILYRRTTVATSRSLKVLFIFLKSAALAIILFCLFQPRLTTSNIIPQKSYLGLIMDDSRSMTIRDIGKFRSRGELGTDLLYGDNGLINRLGKNFRLRVFRFDTVTRRISGPGEFSFKGPRTSLAQSLEHVADELKGLRLSGLVLMTDGGDNGEEDPIRTASLLRSQNLPVFTIGIGQEDIVKDHGITQVSTTGTVMEDSIFDVHVAFRSQGYNDREIELLIEEGDKVVTSKRIKHEKSGTTKRNTLQLTPEREGLLVYTVRIPEESDEIITENNRRTFLVNNLQKRVDILYIEGHPRNEYKFIRRAAEADKALRLVTYLQTAPHKFLRQGIESPQELATGYPNREEDLYTYEAIIFGDISKTFFTAEQLAMTRDFVSKRGGGFLMIGGSTAFDEGFIDTPIADLLPVTLMREVKLPPQLRGGALKGDHPTGRTFSLHLTPEGERSALLRLSVEDEENLRLWSKMPQLQGINVTGHPKPGATVLAVHPILHFNNEPLPVIAHERYGRGRTMAITTASTWRWQMLLPHEDMLHERFWRQLLRWLTATSPPQVELNLDRNLKVRVKVTDNAYVPNNDATIWLKITDPTGAIQDIQLEWAIEEDGIYTGAFTVQKEGIYSLEVSPTSASGEMGEASASFLVAESYAEYDNTRMDATLLRKIAFTSGGKYYSYRNVDRLIDDLEHLPNDYSVDVEKDIWDMPLIFLLLLAFFSMEWLTRRRKGMS
jgi:uncharacterized membrane protein